MSSLLPTGRAKDLASMASAATARSAVIAMGRRRRTHDAMAAPPRDKRSTEQDREDHQ